MATKNLQTLNLKFDQLMFNSLVNNVVETSGTVLKIELKSKMADLLPWQQTLNIKFDQLQDDHSLVNQAVRSIKLAFNIIFSFPSFLTFLIPHDRISWVCYVTQSTVGSRKNETPLY